MKQRNSSALGGSRWLLSGLVFVLFLNFCLCAFLLAATAGLAALHPDLGLGWAVAPMALVVLTNLWALAWAGKALYFIGIFGAWPRSEGAPLEKDDELAVFAAGRAFDTGDFHKVPGLLARVPPERLRQEHYLALGRALALSGAMQEAAEALDKAGARPDIGAKLRPGRRFRPGAAPYFGPELAGRAARAPWMAALAAALVLGGAAVTTGLALQVAKLGHRLPSFNAGALASGSAFQSEVSGRLTVYYHDPEFRDQAVEIAEAALTQDLAFLGLPADTFGPGAVKLYLCDSEEEYRERAPSHPSWEAACAMPPDATLYIHRFGAREHVFFEVVMAHELGHLCYFRLIGSSPDDWLNEGTADYMGYRFALDRAGIARQAWLQNTLFASLRSKALPFDLFFRTDPHQLPDDEVATFYQQGFSVVYLLIEDYGRDPFLKFLHQFTAHKDINAALADAFPTIPNINALAAVWSLFYPKAVEATSAPGTTPGV